MSIPKPPNRFDPIGVIINAGPSQVPDSTPNLDAQTAYYVSLLLFQYRTQPNASATIRILAKKALMDDLSTQLLNAFSLGTAVGAQLDILGKYIGVSRQIGSPAAKPYFGYVSARGADSQNFNGFRDVTNPATNPTGLFYSSAFTGQQNTALPDVSYAFVLNLQIILNLCDGTLSSIQNYLNTLLPGYVTVVDNQNMTLTYNVASNAPLSASILTAFLPKPMGVGIIVNSFTPPNIFTRITSDGATRVTSDGASRIGSIGPET